MNPKVLFAVFKRNFLSYFSNPTGYVFICVFVALSSIAEFLPNEFFNANLANLNQLNYWFPFIMLVFVPAITMSIWAEERHEGTDELLLTIPAADTDIVLGKYLAAVAIFTCALFFSLVCNFYFLSNLGRPDPGLFFGTYFGYWLVGLLMLAIGMVASFLTSNLTVAYILGALLNTPAVVMTWADSTGIDSHVSGLLRALHLRGSAAPDVAVASTLQSFSISGQFSAFGRGVVAFSHILFFVALAVVMLYLSTILIARRHWTATRRVEGASHFAVRVLALVVAVLSLVVVTQRFDPLQIDVTSERINSLSPETKAILSKIKTEYPVQITAFLSTQVPEPYMKTKLDIENILREIQTRGGDKIRLEIIPTDPFSSSAELADSRYGIKPRRVEFRKSGVYTTQGIFLGVVFQSGLEKPVIIDFIDRGVPVEYELVRSISTVTKQDRKTIGVLKTGLNLFQSRGARPDSGGPWRIIQELEKAYDVVEVDPASPIDDDYDVLLAVQPSSLPQAEMDNFLNAVMRGIPTAVFEDACPLYVQVPASSEQPRGNPMMGMPPGEKGDLSPLWDALGIQYDASRVVWQDYNPYPKLSFLPEEFVFVDDSTSQVAGFEPFNEANPISSKLQHVTFPMPGHFRSFERPGTEFTPLIRTIKNGGLISFREIWDPMFLMLFGRRELNQQRRHVLPDEPTSYILAAEVTAPLQAIDDAGRESGKNPRENVRVVVVSDIDMLTDPFFALREIGQSADGDLSFDFDNVTVILNILDGLAGDMDLLELRKRRPRHRTLETFDALMAEARRETREKLRQAQKDHDELIQKATDELQARLEAYEEELKTRNLSYTEQQTRKDMFEQTARKQLNAETKELERDLSDRLDQIETSLQKQIRKKQDWYKVKAILFPPIPPLALAIAVFLVRRRRETEGAAPSRLK